MRLLLKERSVLPGFGLTLGYSVLYLSLIVLIPLLALFLRASSMTFDDFLATIRSPRVVAACKLTVLASLCAASVNAVFGTIVAWSLARYSFPGRKFLDALVDLPFALPTAVSGIALTAIYAPKGWLGGVLGEWGIKAAYSQLGVVLALQFIGFPFVVRALQPAIADLDREAESAAMSLGASAFQRFRLITMPALLPALLTGFAMAFARALGEYGSVIFIAGNMPMKTEIASLLIVQRLDEFDYAGAASIAILMLLVSFAILLTINLMQWLAARRFGKAS